jgi:hypothetical protein
MSGSTTTRYCKIDVTEHKMAIIAGSYESMLRDLAPTRGEVKILITTYWNWQE